MNRRFSLESLDSVRPHMVGFQLKHRRRRVNKTLKDLVWTRYIGEHVAIAPCYCCLQKGSSTLYIRAFEAGHVIARSKGGKDTLDNLRPCCGRCNRGTAVKEMYTFQKEVLGMVYPLVCDPGYEERFREACK